MPQSPLAALGAAAGTPISPQDMQDMYGMQMARGGLIRGLPGSQQAGMAAMQQGLYSASPQMVQARQLQNVMQDVQSSTPQQPNEPTLDYNIRLTTALAKAAGRINPNAAIKLMDRAALLTEQKNQQASLLGNTAPEKARDTLETAQGNALQARADEQEFQLGQQKTTAQAGIPAFIQNKQGEFQSFNLADPDQRKAYQTAQQNGGIPWTQAGYQNYQIAKARAAAMVNEQGGTPTSEQEVAHMAVDAIFNPSSVPYRGPAKTQIEQWYVNNGIAPSDIAEAKLEYHGLQAAVTRAGGRAGMMATLENSMNALGQQVIQAASGVTRTSVRALNAAIMAGKTQFSDPGEARYAVAVRSLVSDYARVINGGTGQTTDSAQKDAYSLLSRAAGDGAIAAAVKQMAQRETPIIGQASLTGLAMMSNPGAFPALRKIQAKAGFNALPDVAPMQAAPQGTPAAPQGAPAAPTGLPAGWSVQVH